MRLTVVLKPQVVKELSGRRTGWLEVPCFIKCCVMANLDHPRLSVQVYDVLVSGGIAQKDACVVMPVQLAAAVARLLDAYPRPEYF